MRRGLLIGAGIVSVALAVLGAILPLLPTTVFLLIAAACFARSSSRLHGWLTGHRWLGGYLRSHRSGEGMALSSKLTTLAVLWAGLALSAVGTEPGRIWWVRFILLGVGVGVTAHLLRLKTRRAGTRISGDA